MTVALVSGRNAQATGVDRYATSLVGALKARGADVALVELRRREAKLGPLRAGGVVTLWWQRLFADLDEYELVHALDPAVATRRSDVVTVHDLIPETHPQWGATGIGAKLDWSIARRNARNARHLIAVSAATRDLVQARWGVRAERVSVVYQGIDLHRFRPTPGADAPPWLAPDKPNLVYVGDDNPRKNLALAVRALLPLRDRHGVDARLVRVGPTRFPSEAEAYRSFARRHGLDLVEPGYAADDLLAATYARASCFVWPTYVEGFGLPPLEAMGCGAPVVALDTPVNREVVGALGRYHPDDPDAAADAVAATLAKPPAREALVRHAQQFSWERTARGTLSAYEKARASA